MSRLMKTLLTGGAVLAATASALAAPGDVKATFEIPCKYPADLAADARFLYLLDWREPALHQINPADGTVQRSWPAPTLKPRGLACGDNGIVYVSDDHSGMVYAMDPATGLVRNSFAAPGSRASGLAYAEGALYLLERNSRKIYKLLPEDGTILGYIDCPEHNCESMTHDGRYLWVADRIKDELYMVDPETGLVIAILAAPGPYTAGLAWHDKHLWAADFQTRKLHKLALLDGVPYRIFDQRKARCEYYWALCNYGPAEVRDLTLLVAIPGELPWQRLLSTPDFSQTPAKTLVDQWGQSCALFSWPSVPAGQTAKVSYTVAAEIGAVRYLLIPERTGTLEDIPAEIRQAYTGDGARYRINSPFIQETVRKVVGDEKSPYWIARKIYNYVIDKLEYEMVGGWDVPEVVLKRGSGSCSEYTFAFVALCRAAGLPARYQGSVVVRGDEASVDEAFHRWAQVYLPGYGWVPVDVNKGDARLPADQARGFGELPNRYLITTQGGGGSECLGWGYNSLARYSTTGYCRVEEDNLGFWEPLTSEPPPSSSR